MMIIGIVIALVAIMQIVNIVWVPQIKETSKNGSDDKKLIAKTPLNNISKVLPGLCRDKDCYDVHLYGLDVVATEMANKISKEEMKHYSERKIKVEVNK